MLTRFHNGFAALMLSPQKSNADVLAYEAVESMEQGIWCDWMDWKNNGLVLTVNQSLVMFVKPQIVR